MFSASTSARKKRDRRNDVKHNAASLRECQVAVYFTFHCFCASEANVCRRRRDSMLCSGITPRSEVGMLVMCVMSKCVHSVILRSNHIITEMR